MIKIEIKNRWTGSIIFEYAKDNNTVKETLLEAIRQKINLRNSDLSDSDLSGSNLRNSDLSGSNLRNSDLSDSDLSDSNLSGSNLSDSDLSDSDLRDSDLSDSDLRNSNLRNSNLSGSDLSDSDLSDSDLRNSNLRNSNLSGSDLSDSDLTPIKNDLFIVLLHGMREIAFLKQNIIDGKIDGSTYEGDCACLSGTLENAAKHNNGPQESLRVNSVLSCRDSYRPIERFFLGINEGDTPENSQFSKLALEWIEEFENLVKS